MKSNTNKYSLIRHIETEVKLVVAGTDIAMTLYVLWLIITNTSSWIPGVLFSFTPLGALELYRAGKLFNLCKTYNCMILHTLMVYICCVYQAHYGFGSMLPYFRWIMFLTGVILIVLIIRKLCKGNGCCNKENNIENS